MARGMKDGALALSLKTFLNDRFSDYGRVNACAIDSERGRLTVEAMLKGETQPITAAIERYETERDGEDLYIVLREFSCSRPWIGQLLTQIFKDKRYKLPPAVSRLL